ncbi:hypothetical protein CMsap09_07510 [Clavibacter michiganensis]|uniref:Uncharacterized protein n=1 Tax=Clavibacter michiganensis TaxID=28447 RepID=A0A251XU12_9MICO|nr:hypothetical protein CMsap09_07510 [Clavibacter michiganensis]
MLDDDERGARRRDDRLDGAPHLADALGVEVRGRLVEEEEPRAHGEHAGEGEPLLLAAGERRRGPVEGDVEAHRVEGGADAGPDLLTRDAEVLAAERHVVADTGEDHLRVRILQHEPGAAPETRRVPAVDAERPAGLALVVAAEHARERVHEGRLAGTGRAEQEHALPRLDDEVDVPDRPGAAAGVPPAPALRADGRPADRTRGHPVRQVDAGGRGTASRPPHGQTRAAVSRPEAKRESAPVRASARATSHERRPAMTAPETSAAIV